MRSRVCLREMHVFTNGERVSYMSVRDVCIDGVVGVGGPLYGRPPHARCTIFFTTNENGRPLRASVLSLRATYNIEVSPDTQELTAARHEARLPGRSCISAGRQGGRTLPRLDHLCVSKRDPVCCAARAGSPCTLLYGRRKWRHRLPPTLLARCNLPSKWCSHLGGLSSLCAHVVGRTRAS